MPACSLQLHSPLWLGRGEGLGTAHSSSHLLFPLTESPAEWMGQLWAAARTQTSPRPGEVEESRAGEGGYYEGSCYCV
jgi:hypothetical protein